MLEYFEARTLLRRRLDTRGKLGPGGLVRIDDHVPGIAVDRHHLGVAQRVDLVAQTQPRRDAVRAGDDGDVRGGAAMAADHAADTLQWRARQIPGADVVGDQDRALRDGLEAD